MVLFHAKSSVVSASIQTAGWFVMPCAASSEKRLLYTSTCGPLWPSASYLRSSTTMSAASGTTSTKDRNNSHRAGSAHAVDDVVVHSEVGDVLRPDRAAAAVDRRVADLAVRGVAHTDVTGAPCLTTVRLLRSSQDGNRGYVQARSNIWEPYSSCLDRSC